MRHETQLKAFCNFIRKSFRSWRWWVGKRLCHLWKGKLAAAQLSGQLFLLATIKLAPIVGPGRNFAQIVQTKKLTGRWLCGKSFATCQKGKTSCSVVVMMVAVCCCWRPTAFLPANSQFNKLLIWGTMLIPTIFERNNEGVGCIISLIVWATALLQLQLHKQIQLQNCRFEQLQIQLFCTAPSHAWTAFSNTAKGPHSHTPIKIGWEQYQLFMKMMFRILFSRIKLR